MTVANAIVKSMRTHKRKASDFYPTPVEATGAIIPILVSLGVLPGARVGEPACGNGKMARILERDGKYEVIASDLRERTGYGLGGYDYLKGGDDPNEGSLGWLAEYGLLDAIVTNPPFDVAEAFVRKAIGQAPVVAMLLKSNYWNTGRGLRLWDDHPPTGRYDITWRLAFLEAERGKAPLMDCTWYVWKRGDPPLQRPLARPTVEPLESMLTVSLGDLSLALSELTEAMRDASH